MLLFILLLLVVVVVLEIHISQPLKTWDVKLSVPLKLSPAQWGWKLDWWTAMNICCKDCNYFFLCCFLLFLFSLSYLHIGKHILHYFRHQSKKKHGIQLRSNSQLMYRDETSLHARFIGRQSTKLIVDLTQCNINSKVDFRKRVRFWR